MKALLVTLIAVLGVLVSPACGQTDGGDDPGEVRIAVTVLDPDGNPISLAPIVCDSGEDFDRGFTDASGRLVCTLPRHDDPMRVSVRLTDSRWYFWIFERTPAERALEYLRARYVIPGTQEIDVGPERDRYDVTLRMRPSVCVRMAFAGAGIEPSDRVSVAVRSANARNIADLQREIQVTGVARGEPAELWIRVHPKWSTLVELSEDQTSGDLDLGVVEIPAFVADVPIDILVRGTEVPLEELSISKLSFLTLIDESGRRSTSIQLMHTGRTTNFRGGREPDTPKEIPAGTYYLVPDNGTTARSLAVAELLRSGNGSELRAAGVPVIEAVEGELLELEIDKEEILRAIDEMP